MSEIPEKAQYKLSEVCQFTDTQPYVLRFWESEFPQLNPERSRSGQPIYSRGDVETVLRIKELLEEGEQSIADVRELLDNGSSANEAVSAAKPAHAKKSDRGPTADFPGRNGSAAPPKKARPRLEPAPAESEEQRQESLTFEAISRERYENALDEIAHMRLEINDADARHRRSEQALKKVEEANERLRARSARAMAVIEEVIERLGVTK